ncbi:UNVERIFIED_CONTAM: hypothetical protein RMT77_009859 [Armadillidium vulgare]
MFIRYLRLGNSLWNLKYSVTNKTVKHLCIPLCHLSSSTTVRFQEVREKKVEEKLDYPLELIRNFSIIAHIDHGKSTLADRVLELTGAIKKNEENKQVLDKLQVEKERGITVKAQSASIFYHHNNKDYLLNLIDTPGHVDFSYEVSRSVAACQGVILLVDANHGVQAQTVANFYIAFTSELTIIPVLNKIDLKNAKPEEVTEEIMNIFDIDPDSILKISAKFGTGVDDLLKAIVDRIPPPTNCDRSAPFRALLYDSWYDKYKGVICQIFVVDGTVSVGDQIQSHHTGKSYEVKNIAYLSPDERPVQKLLAGQVGILNANIRETSEALIGDTFHLKGQKIEPLPGFKEPTPMVYAGIYPIESNDQLALKNAIEKLTLNDSSVKLSVESSNALGQGWRVGFLGLLHMDVFNTRLEQEHGTPVVVTTPSVSYKIKRRIVRNIPKQKNKKATVVKEEVEEFIVNNPARWPEDSANIETYEPMAKATIITPEAYVQNILPICEERRGEQVDIKDLDSKRVIMVYKFPLNEIVVDFFDELKSVTSGYATFDYEDAGYELTDLVKIGIKLNGNMVDELSFIVHRSKAQVMGRKICLKLVETLPRQLFQIAIQAVINSKVIARETIRAAKKDVTAKCYGGDVTRKMKLLQRQAEGKKRMKMIGNIEIPRNTFIEVLKK